MIINEQTLAEQCRRGNDLARRQLYETYAGFLFGVCLRYVGDRPTAEDLLHDGFLQVFTHFDQFHWVGEGSVKAWLFKVQQNVILTYLRKNQKLLDTVSLEDHLIEAEKQEEPETVKDIPRSVLMKMIGELPPGYRAVFNMYVIDGLPHKEIARLLGIQEKSSSSQLLHARRLLANKINKWRTENL